MFSKAYMQPTRGCRQCSQELNITRDLEEVRAGCRECNMKQLRKILREMFTTFRGSQTA